MVIPAVVARMLSNGFNTMPWLVDDDRSAVVFRVVLAITGVRGLQRTAPLTAAPAPAPAAVRVPSATPNLYQCNANPSFLPREASYRAGVDPVSRAVE